MCRPAMQHIAVFGSAQGIRWRLNHIHSMKYADVISASIVANSAGIDYSTILLEYPSVRDRMKVYGWNQGICNKINLGVHLSSSLYRKPTHQQ